ncbi:MAG TPA: carboxypeptidase-like regulatory domain-containing protein [Lysobacter sp.]|nr:carboxypeptidase-like regulatory domain-containing protein [Lysobacter sp.]
MSALAAPPREEDKRARANIVTQAVLLTVGGPAAQDESPRATVPAEADEGASGDDEYRDRILGPSELAPLPPEEDDITDPGGLPRSLRLEALGSRNERGDESFAEYGARVGAFWETYSLGSFSLEANALTSDRDRQGNGGWGGSATLWQRGFALDGGWSVDNGFGVLNTPTVPLQREQYRFFLPTVTFAGASTAWTRKPQGLELQAAFGRAGRYEGTRVVGFDVADGHVGALGAQWRWTPEWTGAASLLVTDGRLVPDADGTLPAFPDARLEPARTRALYAGTARTLPDGSLQLNLLASDGDGLDAALGGWFDYTQRRGRYRHHAGAFWLQPDLAWGTHPINNNVVGAYYRLGYQYARWQWTVGVDRLKALEGEGLDGWYATGYARYQASTTLGYGGSLSLRRTPDTAHSLQLFLDKRTDWGQTRLQFDQARSARDNDSWLLTVDQALPLQQGRRLSVSASYGSLSYEDGEDSRTASVAVYGSADLTDTLSIDGTARWTESDGPAALRGRDINLGLNWRLADHWLLTAAYYESRGAQRSPFVIDPLANEQPFVRLPRDRAVLLTLQFHRQAGSPQAVLGGPPDAAHGRIAGSVFLDDNDDGVRAASEQPAANLTVILDGRWSVRTDSLGNFEFPRVAVGTHTLTVLPDNLPLPWFIDDTAARTVEVRVRDTARADIGARRPR